MEGIQVSLERVGPSQNISVIKVGGYIDTTTSAELEHSLSTLLKENNYNIIIDLGNVDYISSAGWGIFISEIKGIRERNGDLKLVRMVPDVYEVFELLEFHYILKAFDTLEEAIADFDTSGDARVVPLQPPTATRQGGNSVSTSEPEAHIAEAQHGVDAAAESEPTTLEEKLRVIVIEKPDAGLFQLIKVLNTPRFGNIKLGWFEMRKHLKQLNLDSKRKRVAFFKQHTFG